MSNYISKADTNKIIRKCLKEAFPGVKFSVKGSGRDATRIYWTDGPNSAQVNAVVSRFQSSGFDGMTDYQYSIYQEMNGEKVTFMTDYIFTEHSHSDDTIQQCIDLLYSKHKKLLDDNNEPKPTLNTWYNVYLKTGGDHFIQEMRSRLYKLSFCPTQYSATADSVKVTGNELEKQQRAQEEREAKEKAKRKEKLIEEIAQLELDLHPIMTGTTKIKSVLVNWSESGELKSNTEYSYQEFEAIANAEALKDSGFYKTSVCVTFEDGEQYQCRIDLSIGTNGFYQHMIALIAYLKSNTEYANNIKASDQALYDFYMNFFQTYDLKIDNNVTDLNQFKAKKEQDKKADDFANALLATMEKPNYRNGAVKVLAEASEKIVYFSGGVEYGETRDVRQCELSQVLKAASLLTYEVKLLPGLVRLTFDSDYFYDFYLQKFIGSELLNELLDLLKKEIDHNWDIKNLNQEQFNKTINNLLKK